MQGCILTYTSLKRDKHLDCHQMLLFKCLLQSEMAARTVYKKTEYKYGGGKLEHDEIR